MKRGLIQSRRALADRLFDAANCAPGNGLGTAFLAAADEAIRQFVEELEELHADPEESYTCSGVDEPCAIENRLSDLQGMLATYEKKTYERTPAVLREELRVYRELETALRACAACRDLHEAARHRDKMADHLEELDRLRGITPAAKEPPHV